MHQNEPPPKTESVYRNDICDRLEAGSCTFRVLSTNLGFSAWDVIGFSGPWREGEFPLHWAICAHAPPLMKNKSIFGQSGEYMGSLTRSGKKTRYFSITEHLLQLLLANCVAFFAPCELAGQFASWRCFFRPAEQSNSHWEKREVEHMW